MLPLDFLLFWSAILDFVRAGMIPRNLKISS